MKNYLLSATISLVLSITALAQKPSEIRIEPYTFVTNSGEKIEAEFSRIYVPEKHAKPKGKLIELAFVRFKATAKIPSFPLVYLAGGPGGSGISLAKGARFPLFMALREIGDVIALDQRGAGLSKPALTCQENLGYPLDKATEKAQALRLYQERSKSCADFWKRQGVDLTAYNTNENADDLEVLRKALGAEKITLWASSYGTHLALTFIARHEKSVHRVMLAGVEGKDDTFKLPSTLDEQLKLVNDLVKQDKQLSENIPDFIELVQQVFAKLEKEPAEIEVLDSQTRQHVKIKLGKFDLQQLTIALLGDRSGKEVLPAVFYSLDSGDHNSVYLKFAAQLILQQRRDSIGSAMAFAMDCSSFGSPQRFATIAREGKHSMLGGAPDFPFPEVCSAWGNLDLGENFRQPVKSKVPVLFISGTFDGKTPPRNAAEVRQGFPNSFHVLLEGAGHGDELFVSSPKIKDVMLEFMRDVSLSTQQITLAPFAFKPITATKSKPLVFTHATVIDATGTDAQSDMVVIVTGDTITDIGKFGKLEFPKNAQVIDATGKFLMPGLWDMHVHLTKAGENTLPLFIANGVTSVRDMGGDYVQLLQWRKEAADGTRLSPRIKTPGALLESAENVARMKREGTVEPVDKFRIGIATPEAARKAVDLMASLGVDFIKFRTVASPETYQAIAEESKAKGLMFVGHQFGSPETMVEAGQKSIEHYIFPPIITNPKHAEIYKKMAESGVYVVPTIVVADKSLLVSYDEAKTLFEDTKGKIDFRRKYLSGYLIADWKEQLEEKKQPSPIDLAKLKEVLIKDLQEMHKAGVRLMPGTDVATLLIYPGYSLHDELQLLVKYVGLTPLQAIISATRYPAEFFGLQNKLGTIEKGKLADLVLLEANPLDDISNTKRIAAVVLNGRSFSQEARGKMLADVEAGANKK